MEHKLVRTLAATAIAGGLGLTGVGTATAAPTQHGIGDLGNTRVAVAPAVAAKLTRAGITPSPIGLAKAFPFQGTLALRFPIYNTRGNGNRINHSGGVQLAKGHAMVSLTRFRVNLNKMVISARVNHDSRVTLFNIVKSHRPKLGPVRLTFNATAAKALNSTFGVKAFSAGKNFAFAKVNLKK
jgi:hypothetical protein